MQYNQWWLKINTGIKVNSLIALWQIQGSKKTQYKDIQKWALFFRTDSLLKTNNVVPVDLSVIKTDIWDIFRWPINVKLEQNSSHK